MNGWYDSNEFFPHPRSEIFSRVILYHIILSSLFAFFDGMIQTQPPAGLLRHISKPEWPDYSHDSQIVM